MQIFGGDAGELVAIHQLGINTVHTLSSLSIEYQIQSLNYCHVHEIRQRFVAFGIFGHYLKGGAKKMARLVMRLVILHS